MSHSPSEDAHRSADRAEDLAEQAANHLDEAHTDADKAADTDVEDNTEAPVDPHPSGKGPEESDLHKPGAPMP